MVECNLTLLCPPALEEKLLDALLMLPQVVVFTSTPTAAHGVASGLSAMEQVLGRALVTQIQVLLALADKDLVLSTIRRDFAGAGVRFWITPILHEGAIL